MRLDIGTEIIYQSEPLMFKGAVISKKDDHIVLLIETRYKDIFSSYKNGGYFKLYPHLEKYAKPLHIDKSTKQNDELELVKTWSVVYETEKGLKVSSHETEYAANLHKKILDSYTEFKVNWVKVIPSEFIKEIKKKE
ncbi:hypothetical protein AAXE64_07560 [Priestia megaterium]